MISLILTREQAQVLAGAIESYLSDLRMEITDTDSSDYRGMLKERRDTLVSILGSIHDLQESTVE